ncbi:hypothetical protein F4775DRAFT_539198 [Biscogniauxia sp. FL1348]|nr:hypothetical protein F4775DRAFT_539198 [Biscogniauxia sp. FL1348]
MAFFIVLVHAPVTHLWWCVDGINRRLRSGRDGGRERCTWYVSMDSVSDLADRGTQGVLRTRNFHTVRDPNPGIRVQFLNDPLILQEEQ